MLDLISESTYGDLATPSWFYNFQANVLILGERFCKKV